MEKEYIAELRIAVDEEDLEKIQKYAGHDL